jgi:hypothetical protein
MTENLANTLFRQQPTTTFFFLAIATSAPHFGFSAAPPEIR